MSTATDTHRPSADEHSAYYGIYINQVPPGDILAHLAEQIKRTTAPPARPRP